MLSVQIGAVQADKRGFIPDIFVSHPKSQPSEVVVIWKGGARKRADDVLLFRRNKRTSEQSGLCSDVAEKEGFEPSNTLWVLHDFQSCALGRTTRLLRVKKYAVS